MLRKARSKRKADDDSLDGHCLTRDELASIERYWSRARQGNFGCWPRDANYVVTRLRPVEDDLLGRLFNVSSCINIYSGLIVSGLIGYVLAPEFVEHPERLCEITGLQLRTLEEMQMAIAHVNLVVSMCNFGASCFVCVGICTESHRTVLRAASKFDFAWTLLLSCFFQVFLLQLQLVLAALIYMRTPAAKLTIAVDMLIFGGCLSFTQVKLHDMFPLFFDGFLWAMPLVCVRQLLFGRKHVRRLGELAAQEAIENLGIADLDAPPTPEKGDGETAELEKALLDLLAGALPSAGQERAQAIARAMLDEQLTSDVVLATARRPQGYAALLDFLDLPAAALTRGERLRIANVACQKGR